MSLLQIRQASDLFDALRCPSVKTRLAVLRAIADSPAPALQLGRLHDWDVIDELVHQAYQSCSVPYYRMLMRALAGYDDPRVVGLFVKVAGMARDEEIVETVCGYLHRNEVTVPWRTADERPAGGEGSAGSGGARTPSDVPPA